jgi:ATP-dependent RNA helicase DeaD
VHRIGRTARAGKSGKVINILSPGGPNLVFRIMKAYPEMTITQLNVPVLKKVNISNRGPKEKFFKKRKGQHKRKFKKSKGQRKRRKHKN